MILKEVQKESKITLADILVSEGVMTADQLGKCRDVKDMSEVPFEQAVISMGFATRESIANALSAYYDVPYVDLDSYDIDTDILKIVSERLARKYKFLPLFKITNILTIAISDPRNLYGIDEIRDILDCDIGITVATENQILQSLDRFYGNTVEDLTDIVDEIVQNEFDGFDEDVEVEKVKEVNLETVSEEMLEKSPVVKLLNTIIHRAIREGVSDIHIQHEEDSMLIRYRLDGILYHATTLPRKLRNTLVSRIKVISGMNIAESRLPQDGRFKVKITDREYDLRVSTMQTVHGECVVMRILDQRTAAMSLDQLGFAKRSLETYQSFIERPNGIVLITGPTGSGKTTTLYASLNRINSPDKNIITVEDPVEYRLNLIRQTQVNTKAGITFSYAMRSILRQDPDVIMIGEMRDRETAEIAIQAAMTGHLVFSTLHTNDAPGAISRLIDMGIEPFLIASSVIGIVAQRLVRANCTHCTETYVPGEKLLMSAGLNDKADITFSKGKGCERCRESGYKGRIGLYETLIVDDKIRDLIIKQETPHVIAKTAGEAQGFKTLIDDGLDKVENGLTSLEEVLTVASSA